MKSFLRLAFPAFLFLGALFCAVFGFAHFAATGQLIGLIAGFGWTIVSLHDLRKLVVRIIARKGARDLREAGMPVEEKHLEKLMQLWEGLPPESKRLAGEDDTVEVTTNYGAEPHLPRETEADKVVRASQARLKESQKRKQSESS